MANIAKPANKPAQAAPQPAPVVATPIAPAPAAPTYVAGKPYNPRTNTLQGNAASWAVVQAHLSANGGQTTLAALQAYLTAQRNHANFAKYAIRRGWLVVGSAPKP